MQHLYTKKKFISLILPLLVVYTLLFVVPMLMGMALSLTTYNGLKPPKWNNFGNYERLFGDKVFWNSILNTLKAGATNFLIVLPISFLLGYSLRLTSKKNTLYKTVVFMPYILPGTIVGLIWYFIFIPSGLVNGILGEVGILPKGDLSAAIKFIGGEVLTPYSVGLVVSWSGMGFYMVLWQLGIKNLPSEVMEASLIDGCNKRQQMTKIMLPLLRDTTTNIMLFVLTGALAIYETVFMLTGGGPNHLSETIVSYLYVVTFAQGYYGYGMAIAFVEFLFAVIVAAVSLLLSRRKRIDF